MSRLLRLVAWANYFMLVIGGSIALTTITKTLWESTNASEALGFVAFAGWCGFIAWVAWSNVGVLNAVIHRLSLFGMLLATIPTTLYVVALIITIAFTDTKLDDGMLRSGIAASFIAFTSAPAVISLVVLRRLKVQVATAERLPVFLRRSISNLRAQCRGTEPPHLESASRLKAAGFIALAIGWMTTIDYLVDLPAFQSVAKNPQTISSISSVGWLLLLYARHYLRPDFKTVRSGDYRPPIVFLRSFEDDEKVNYQRADRAWFDFSLESRLADHFNALGPFVAVGKPGDDTPMLGAARAKLADDEWQGTVAQWMADSALIIVMIGRTHWVGWELSHIVEMGYVGKLLIVFPQSRKWLPGRYLTEADLRVTRILDSFRGTEWESAIQQLGDPRRLRSLVFLPGGGVSVVTSSARNRESYHLGALVAHDALLAAGNIGQRADDAAGNISKSSSPGWRWWAAVCGGGGAALATVVVLALAWLRNASETVLTPLPPGIYLESTGKLKVANLKFVDPANGKALPQGSHYTPGQTVKLEYWLGGCTRNTINSCDLALHARFAQADGQDAMAPIIETVNTPTDSSGGVVLMFQIQLLPGADSGDYKAILQIVDKPTGEVLTFKPVIPVRKQSN